MNILCLLFDHIREVKIMPEPVYVPASKEVPFAFYRGNKRLLKRCLRCKKIINLDGFTIKEIKELKRRYGKSFIFTHFDSGGSKILQPDA